MYVYIYTYIYKLIYFLNFEVFKMNAQQKWFGELNKVKLGSLKGAVVFKDSKTGKYNPGKRYNLDKFDIYDERSVAYNEIVFDFDWTSTTKNYQIMKCVVEVLESRQIPFYVTATGGKGFHIHCFFNKIKFIEAGNLKLKDEAHSYGFKPKHIRLWFWNLILEEAGIPLDQRGVGKNKVDKAVISFDIFAGKEAHLIRAIGGRKMSNRPDGGTEVVYKTYVPTDELSPKKVRVTNFESVRFPDTISCFNIDEYEMSEYLTEFIQYQKNNNIQKLENVKLNGKYTELESVLKIRDGLPTGQRNFGARVLASACKLDKMGKKESRELLKEYAENCSQTSHKFSPEEGYQWIEWFEEQDVIYWNCNQLNELGLHDEAECEFCKCKNRDSIELLTKTTLLKKIQKILDQEIVGESSTKMLVFLLMLSKDFPSETGKPAWNLPGDPMAQNIILSSDSSSGKSYVAKRILRLFGTEGRDYYVISRLTKNAINYYTEQNMDGKIIFIEEMQGLDENTAQLRVWMSEGKLALDTVEKIQNEEGIEVNTLVRKTTQGQPVFMTCQAEGMVGSQINNRSWLLSMDLSESQTNDILDYQDNLNKGDLSFDGLNTRILQDALKQLKPYHFIIPFANYKAMNIPINTIRARRDYQKFLTLVKCVTFLHQKQREIITNEQKQEFLVADIKDYDIAREYSQNVLGATFTGLTIAQIDLLNLIKKSSWSDEFNISDVQRLIEKSGEHIRGQLNQLVDLGFLSCERSKGVSSLYGMVDSKSLKVINLPTGTELLERIGNLQPPSENTPKLGKIIESETYSSQLKNPSFEELHLEVRPPFEPKTPPNNLQVEPPNGLQASDLLYTYIQSVDTLSDPEIIWRFPSDLEVLKYITEYTDHLTPIEEIFKNFNDSTVSYITILIDSLKSKGLIVEVKKGMFMIV